MEPDHDPEKWWQSDLGRLSILSTAFIIIVVLLYQVAWSGLQGKNVWDWLELIIVPVVLAGGGLLLQRIEDQRTKREEALDKLREERQAEREKQQAKDNLMDSIFQSYLDDMSDLLITQRLQTMLNLVTADRQATANGETASDDVKLAEATAVVTVARARTVTAFKSLDVQRRTLLAQFLRETGLVVGERGTLLVGIRFLNMDFSETDFYRFNLSGAILYKSDLSHANLFQANLSGASLWHVDLSHADLGSSILHHATLHKANLTQADLENTTFDDRTALPDSEVVKWNADFSEATYTKYWSEDTDMTRYTNPEHPHFWQSPQD